MTMGLLNSRPLGPITFDPGQQTPLTPNSFLLGREYQGLDPEQDIHWDFGKEWTKVKKMESALWERFVHELLPSLQGHRRWSQGGEPLKRGDYVCLLDGKRKGMWPLAEVVEIYPNKTDGQVREADVRDLETGKIYRRSMKNMFRIDDENKLKFKQEFEPEELEPQTN